MNHKATLRFSLLHPVVETTMRRRGAEGLRLDSVITATLEPLVAPAAVDGLPAIETVRLGQFGNTLEIPDTGPLLAPPDTVPGDPDAVWVAEVAGIGYSIGELVVSVPREVLDSLTRDIRAGSVADLELEIYSDRFENIGAPGVDRPRTYLLTQGRTRAWVVSLTWKCGQN